jgi:hypothetical protein
MLCFRAGGLFGSHVLKIDGGQFLLSMPPPFPASEKVKYIPGLPPQAVSCPVPEWGGKWGCDRASATTFADPGTYLRSKVNSVKAAS